MNATEIAVLSLAASTIVLFLMLVWQNRRHAECKTDARFDEIHRELGKVWDEMDEKIERHDRDISDRFDALERSLEAKSKV